jgi:hypothetical protein
LDEAELFYDWEPEPIDGTLKEDPTIQESESIAVNDDNNRLFGNRQSAEEVLSSVLHIQSYPDELDGASVHVGLESAYDRTLASCENEGGGNVWWPFKSRIDWEVARWAKLRGPGSTAFTMLLSIDGVSLMA